MALLQINYRHDNTDFLVTISILITPVRFARSAELALIMDFRTINKVANGFQYEACIATRLWSCKDENRTVDSNSADATGCLMFQAPKTNHW